MRVGEGGEWGGGIFQIKTQYDHIMQHVRRMNFRIQFVFFFLMKCGLTFHENHLLRR